jgi:hypothetical protein
MSSAVPVDRTTPLSTLADMRRQNRTLKVIAHGPLSREHEILVGGSSGFPPATSLAIVDAQLANPELKYKHAALAAVKAFLVQSGKTEWTAADALETVYGIRPSGTPSTAPTTTRFMQCVLLAGLLALAGCAPKDGPTLGELLAIEATGELDDQTITAAEQIDEATQRAGICLETTRTRDERAAVKAAYRKTVNRIMERARQRVRDAEEHLRTGEGQSGRAEGSGMKG